MIIGIIIIIILLIGSIGVFIDGIQSDMFSEQLVGMFGIIVLVLMLTMISISYTEESESTPQAIDVYRGKTILEITYRDSIPVDSIVVYKPEFKK